MGSVGLTVGEIGPPAPLPPGLLMRPGSRVALDDLAEAALITPLLTVASAGPPGPPAVRAQISSAMNAHPWFR